MATSRRAPSTPRSEEIAYYQQRAQDRQRAEARLGATADARVSWLLHFAAEDPAKLSTGELQNRWDEVLAFAMPMRADVPRGLTSTRAVTSPMPDVALLRRLTRELRAGLRLVAGEPPQPWRLPEATVTVKRMLRGTGDRMPLSVRTAAVGLRPLVLHQAAAELVACDHLRRCPECKELFVAIRRQLRHSKCAQRARERRRQEKLQQEKEEADG